MSGLRCDGQGTALENMPEPGDRRAGHMYALDESTTPSTHVIVSGKGEVALQTFDMKELLEYWKGLDMKYPSVQVVRTNLNLGFNGRYFYVLRTGPSCYGLRSTREYKTYEGAQKAGERTITRLRKVLQQEEIK